MSKITTRSVFYYGTSVRLNNRYLDFAEGGPVILAVMPVGDYTLSEFALALQQTLNTFGTYDYIVSVNRVTRVLTISASGNFSILPVSGPRSGQSVLATAGFTTDQTGSDTYQGDIGAGKEYQTQYPISEYTSPEHSIVFENGSYNVTPAGIAQVVSFGDGSRVEMNIRLISDELNNRNQGFFAKSQGIQDALNFIFSGMLRDRLEFMRDVDSRNSFDRLILESTPESGEALEFRLKNMNTPNYYETGTLVFRKLLL